MSYQGSGYHESTNYWVGWNGLEKLSHAEKQIQRQRSKTMGELFYKQKHNAKINGQTSPKPFPYYSKALQQIHKRISCKARTMEHCKHSDRVQRQVYKEPMVPVKEETLKRD